MKKLIMAIAVGSLAVAGMACGGGSPCEDYEAAAASCGEAYAAAMNIDTSAAEGEAVASVCGTDAAKTDAQYECMTAAYDGADCTTMDGMMAASTAAAACATAAEGDEAAAEGDEAAAEGDEAAAEGDEAAAE